MTVSDDNLTDIEGRLRAIDRMQNRIHLQAAMLRWFSVSLCLAALLVTIEALTPLSTAGRQIGLLTVALGTAASFLYLPGKPLLRWLSLIPLPDPQTTALVVGEVFPSVRDRLLNVLQVSYASRRGSLYSADLASSSLDSLSQELSSLDFTRAIDHQPLRRAIQSVAITLGITGALALLFPSSFADSLDRLARFDTDFFPLPLYSITVSPGSAEVISGQDVDISVRVQATRGASTSDMSEPVVSIQWKPEEQTSFEHQTLAADSSRLYRMTLRTLRSSVLYLVSAGEQTTPLYRLTVLDRPLIQSFQVRITPPSYTGLPPRLNEPFIGDVLALPGTRLAWTATASKPLVSAALCFSDGLRRPLVTTAERFAGTYLVIREQSYHLEVRDSSALTNPYPVTYRIQLQTDRSPAITLLQPGQNIDVAGAESLPLLVRISDDFGFSRLQLSHRLIHSRFEPPQSDYRSRNIPLPPTHRPTLDISFPWDLRPLSLAPEDIVEYFLEVSDNDTVSGPKTTRTPLYQLRLPSLEEIFTDLDEGHRDIATELQQSLEQTADLKDRIESIQEDIKKNRATDWRQEQRAEELRGEYGDVQKKLDAVEQRLEKMLDQMNQQRVLSPETLEKYLELQQLFSELNSSELQSALQRLQQSLQTVNRDQLQQALQQTQFSEERFRSSIERTLNLLKRIQIEQKLDELRKRTEQLLEEQEALDTAADTLQQDESAREGLARRQEQLKDKMNELQQQSQDAQRRMEEFFTEMPAERLDDLNAALQKRDPAALMQRAASELRSNRIVESNQTRSEIMQHLSEYSQGLESLQQELLQQQAEQILAELRRATEDLIDLSKRQEGLRDQSRTAPQNSPQLRQNAQQQLALIQSLGTLTDQLVKASQKSFVVTPEMGKSVGMALAHMQNALRQLEVRSAQAAAQQQTAAMGSLNQAALQMQGMIQALLRAGGSGGGLLQQLQAVAGQQLSINLGVQGLAEQEATRRASEAARLALEQEAVRKSLQQLQQEARSGADGQRALGDLERIAEEMREVVHNLEQNTISPETIRRQERILSRLLDAARSMRERDFEKRRLARPGSPFARRSPAELDPRTMEQADRLRQDLLRALERGYARDYQELIRKYFEELQKLEDVNP